MADQLIEMTTDIVASYVSGNTVPTAELPALIQSVFKALSNIDAPLAATETPEVAKATSAQIRKSITQDGLISFEDGKTYQTLKRHLTKRGMTLTDYKAKWGLPKDYPTSAPGYSARRSEMAKAIGLGRKAKAAAAAEPATAAPKAKRAVKAKA